MIFNPLSYISMHIFPICNWSFIDFVCMCVRVCVYKYNPESLVNI